MLQQYLSDEQFYRLLRREVKRYMRQLNRQLLVQIVACRLFVAKLLSELMLTCNLDAEDETSVKF